MSSDAELMQAWNGGDQTSGGALITRHYDAILRFFRTKAGDDADDLVQRTFLGCLEATSRFRGDSSFRAFLFGIARHVLLEHIRKRTNDRKVDFGVTSIIDVTPGVSTIMFARAEQRLLVQALQRMPVEVQTVLELYYWEDLSVDEVALAVDAPAGTVKSRLYRGRTLLREAMESMPSDSARQVALAMLAEREAPSDEASSSGRD